MHYFLEEIEAHAHLGITPEEQDTPQLVKVSAWFQFDPIKAVNSDDIADTVDYQILYDTIKNFCKTGRWKLLEKLHTDLLIELSKACPNAEQLEISIKKFPWSDGSITVS